MDAGDRTLDVHLPEPWTITPWTITLKVQILLV
jgi:hypothetical protein